MLKILCIFRLSHKSDRYYLFRINIGLTNSGLDHFKGFASFFFDFFAIWCYNTIREYNKNSQDYEMRESSYLYEIFYRISVNKRNRGGG